MMNASNTQRRTFRGRGGPTDRRLPKHNARRRRQQQQQAPSEQNKPSKYDDDDLQETEDIIAEDDESFESRGSGADMLEEEEEEEEGALQILEDKSHIIEPKRSISKEDDDVPSPWIKEVNHLKKRVSNVQETLQLSTSITNPTTYENNALNAVANCVNEWRAIVLHHHPDEFDDKDQEFKKKTALAVFMLIQLSLQCGPLAGAKPGYFKRCGGDVAKVVAAYLEKVVPHHTELGIRMGFTEKQISAMEKWHSNAKKAVEEDKPPSKSQLKKQQGKGKTKNKN